MLKQRTREGGLPAALLVHMGSPQEGAGFLGERWPEARAASDPSKELYRAFGLSRGSLSKLFGPRVFLAGIRSALDGHGIGKPVGDPTQMSGWFLLFGRKILWRHVHEHAGAEPRWEDLHRAWKAVPARPSK